MSSLPAADPPKDKQKKPRHRHSPVQLAALNELYDENEHPALDLRTSLAERLGMETKTVNAWFQNKRASSKKRTRPVPLDSPPINPPIGPAVTSVSSHSSTRHPSEFDDYHDDDYSPIDYQHSRSTSSVPPDHSQPLSSFYAGNPDHTHFLSETDSMPRRMRMRPTAEQTEELRKLYNVNPHPTTDQRQLLAERIGMRYQSITNWFQNQRSLAKKRKEDEADGIVFSASTSASGDNHNEIRTYSAFPPPSNHPSLGFPQHPSSAPVSRAHRSPSVSASLDGRSRRRSSSRRSATPYSSSAASFSRPRRSRPEPYQLEALKELFTKTPTPSIEERSALALEIGMDIGKVTNWFRNLRQTARKRVKPSGSGDDYDYDISNHNSYSTLASRSGSPSFGSSSSSSSMDLDEDDYDMHGIHSDIGSEDEYQEAVTPPPEPELSLPSTSTPASSSRISINQLTLAIDPASYAELEKVSATQYSGIKIEDALLLLSFHHHIVH